MNWNEFLGVLSACLFIVPPILILTSGLYTNKSLLWLCIYCLLNGLYSMGAMAFFRVNADMLNALGVLNNYFDTPLMLLVLLLFCHSKGARNVLRILLVLVILFEICVAFVLRLQPSSTLVISGPGLLLVFCCSLYFFIRQLKLTIQFGKGLGRTVIAAGVFFVYGCYSIIYCFYYLQQVSQVEDVFLLYHFASMIFCLLLIFGVLQLSRQHKRLQQLLQVRRELAQFY